MKQQENLRAADITRSVHSFSGLHSQVMIANAADAFDPDGQLRGEKARTLIGELWQWLVTWTRRLRPHQG